jgi:DNA polymerase I
VRLLSVAAEDGIGGVVDVTKVHPSLLLEVIKNKTLIAHNGKFDLSFLENCFGYEHDGPVVDTQVLDAVIYYAAGPREHKTGWQGLAREGRIRSLSDVARDYLGIELSKDQQTSDFGHADLTEAQVRYALQDAEILISLKEGMMRRVLELGLGRVADLEARFLPALAYCENNGFALYTEGWREQAARAAETADAAATECDALAPPVPEGAGRPVWNWGSTKQVGEALELLGTKLPKTEKGNPKTDDAVLKGITTPEKAARLARAVLRHREAKKKVSTWGLGWFDLPKKKGKKFDKGHQFVVDGRAFTSFRQVVRTGRMSSSQPNLQNLPPESRRHFVAPPGRKLIVADFKNIELVLAGVVAGEEKLLEAFSRGEDVHSMTAHGMLESDPKRAGCLTSDEEVKEFRPVAKLVSFSILYGSGVKGLADGMTNRVGVPTTKEEAQVLMGNFFQAYPRLKRWYVKEHAKAKAGDERSRTLTGRLRLLDKEYRFGQWRVKPQLRLNTPIQGSAGDGFKYAVALLWEKRRECPGDPKVVNLVHDEIVVEIGEEHAEAGRAWLERCMIDGMAEVAGPDVPVSVEIVIADSWDVK